MYSPILAFVQAHKSEIKQAESPFLQAKVIGKLRDKLRHLQEGIYQKEVETLTYKQLAKWIGTAYHALYDLKEKHDYVIQHRNKTGTESQEEITIVDWNNTGRLQEKSRWQGGLHSS